MDYAQLTGPKGTPGAISTWTNNSRIQQDVAEIVLEAESWIYRRLRHWRMMSAPLTGALVSGSDNLALPGDGLEPIMLVLTGTTQAEIVQKTPQDVIGAWAFDGTGARVQQQPQYYYFDQSAFRFDSPADQAYPYALLYFQQPAPLATTVSNFLTETYPRLLRCAVMAAACEWLKDFGQGDAGREYYDVRAMAEIDKAQEESDRARGRVVASAVIVGGAGFAGLPPYGGNY